MRRRDAAARDRGDREGRVFPVDDWQFWVATCAALFALGWLLRPLWKRRARKRGRARRATLTVEGKAVERRRG